MESSKKIFAGNWKLQKGPRDAVQFLTELQSLIGSSAPPRSSQTSQNFAPVTASEWIIFPPFVSLPAAHEFIQKNSSAILLGAQNCASEKSGAFTGEVSAAMIKEVGCNYVLIGHSERRQLFGETNQSCALKIQRALESGLKPMLCVGETQAERDLKKTLEVVKTQLREALSAGLRPSPSSVETHHSKNMKIPSEWGLVVAYEPVWAIGTGKVATPDEAEEVHEALREFLGPVPLLYGGSVKPENASELLSKKNIDGFLVGGASLSAKSFAEVGQINI